MSGQAQGGTDQAALVARAQLMLRLAGEAAQIAMRHFQHPGLVVESKGELGPVTQADREAEAHIRAGVLGAFADDGLLGEEHGARESRSGWTWVIDPIDGTVSFAAGVPLFGVLIGLEWRGEHGAQVRAGVCELPALAERVWACAGQGAWWDRAGHERTPARVSACADLKDALVCTTGSEYYRRAGREPALAAIDGACKRTRGWSDCYGAALAATGRVDLFIDPVMNPWDNGPFPVIFSEAGGRFCDWRGRPGIHGGDAVAGPHALVEQALALVGQIER
jgi:histidinol-phosphatase